MGRLLAINLAVVALAAVGCGSDTASTNSSGSATTTAVSDEQQIRDFVAKSEPYIAGLDFAKLAEMTCAKYRDQIRTLGDVVFPPLSDYGTKEELAGKSRESLIENMQKAYPTVPHASIVKLVDALQAYDDAAYKKAIADVTSRATKRSGVKVDNIKINGATAIADLTVTTTVNNDPPKTVTKANAYVKEDGVWKDCQDPASA